MTYKVLLEFMARLEESAVNYNIHKNEEWKEQLENSRKAIFNGFTERYQEGFEDGQMDMWKQSFDPLYKRR